VPRLKRLGTLIGRRISPARGIVRFVDLCKKIILALPERFGRSRDACCFTYEYLAQVTIESKQPIWDETWLRNSPHVLITTR
jgi:hypothetical protein